MRVEGEPHIVLMGLRGAGKSTVGRLLAGRLGLPFVDLDEVTSGVLGVASPAEGLRRLGEEAFREGEHEALATVLMRPTGVIALGGGTPTYQASGHLLTAMRGFRRIRVAYLHATPAELAERLRRTDLASRPGLLGGDPIAEIGELYRRRDGLYRELAELTIEVGTARPEETVEAVARWVAGAD